MEESPFSSASASPYGLRSSRTEHHPLKLQRPQVGQIKWPKWAKTSCQTQLVAAKEEESSKRVFTRAKSNNSIDTGGFSYTIEALTLKQNIVTTRVVWGEPLEGSSRSILAEVEGDAVNGEGSQLSRAKKFLQDSLTGGFVPARELLEHAREGQGLSCDTVRRAQKELGIRARKLSMNGGWVWELPA